MGSPRKPEPRNRSPKKSPIASRKRGATSPRKKSPVKPAYRNERSRYNERKRSVSRSRSGSRRRRDSSRDRSRSHQVSSSSGGGSRNRRRTRSRSRSHDRSRSQRHDDRRRGERDRDYDRNRRRSPVRDRVSHTSSRLPSVVPSRRASNSHSTRRSRTGTRSPQKKPIRTQDRKSSSASASTSRRESVASQPKPPISSNENESDEELKEVSQWVRSAPAELYYTRNNSGDFIATEVTKKLCTKFERKLVLRAQTARLEAEALGVTKQEELTKQDAINSLQDKRLKIERRAEAAHANAHAHENGVCCSKDKVKVAPESDGKSKVKVEVPPVDNNVDSVVKPKEEQVICKHEEGEICDKCDSETPPPIPIPKPEEKVPKPECSKSSSKCKHNEKQTHKNANSNSKKGSKRQAVSSSGSESDSSSDSDSDDSGDAAPSTSRSISANRELEKRKLHPRRLHPELWHNDPGLMNDGPVCRCSAKARRFGIRHGYYPGETPIPACDPFSTNKDKLSHYRITISPPKNFLVKTPTVISHDGHEYLFEGFSLISHQPIDLKLPPCRVIRFNIRYDVFVAEERLPESFCVQELQLFEKFVFRELLELLDLKYDYDGACAPFHFMPRFVRQLPENGKEILSMNRVLLHLLKCDREVIREEELTDHLTTTQPEWQLFADKHKGMIVSKAGYKPCALRVDQIDRDVSGHENEKGEEIPYPLIIHFGIRPPQLSYAGNTNYQRAWRRYVKYRHLLSNMAKPSAEEKRKLAEKEQKLQKMRTESTMKRDVTVAVSSRGFRATGIFCDLVQHAMLIPVLVSHLRFHVALSTLESRMKYHFTNRYLLQLAMTHPSYRENFGTNPDHARNSLTNCGIRQPEYGDRRIHYKTTRKRGINTLINIMAKFGFVQEMESEITHNERLEFLGDAVVEFVTSIHLFHLFPNLEEGGLATYRAAIVQNQHLAVLAKTLHLDQYMLYAHGSDLCHDSELRHAMANCFEALMGALFLDGGIQVSDRVFATTLYDENEDSSLHDLWVNYPRHPLQQEAPEGDRDWIQSHKVLQKLTEFENSIGVEFSHIRLLARAFTDRSLGYNNLSRGSNQRLEFLGDTVLQLISSEYLYRHFPDHHEGHLSLLRSSLVNNRTQALVCDDLNMPEYAMRGGSGDPKIEMKTKDRADLLEALLGALYIDKGLVYCTTFCAVCFFPRLNKSIRKQEWNDPKSKLQQCCLTLRAMDGREPDIPVYKVTESLGPTNTRVYTVAVYFRGKRLATAKGHSIQDAEMNAAHLALTECAHLFPQLNHQRSVVKNTSSRKRHHHHHHHHHKNHSR